MGNKYRQTATSTFERDDKANPKTVDHPDLIAYVAASAPAHAIDGWSYLARSAEAVLRGDLAAALHLGYYAELRAAMSILACEGIGVFSSRHPVVSKPGNVTASISGLKMWDASSGRYVSRARAGTHAVVWPLLDHWSSLARAGELISSLVAPASRDLRSWLDGLSIPGPLNAISRGWFRQWGIDLTLLNDDHSARNMVSYRPSQFRLPPNPCATDAISFVADLWRLFEPSQGGRFPQLERALLKKVIQQSGVHVDAVAVGTFLGVERSIADGWVNYLNAAPESLVLRHASSTSSLEATENAFQVVSRAALLLFLATGSTRKHLAGAGYTGETLRFFWQKQCEARFLGPIAALPDDPIDLWQDIAEQIADIEEWGALKASPSLGEWRRAQPDAVSQIASLELAGVWGLVS